jgi:ABC-type lipoprotein export system ATPase subunit
LAISRALASDLPVLLIDEPTAGLDAEAKRRVLAALERVRGQRSLVIVTHDSNVAAMADVTARIGVGAVALAAE